MPFVFKLNPFIRNGGGLDWRNRVFFSRLELRVKDPTVTPPPTGRRINYPTDIQGKLANSTGKVNLLEVSMVDEAGEPVSMESYTGQFILSISGAKVNVIQSVSGSILRIWFIARQIPGFVIARTESVNLVLTIETDEGVESGSGSVEIEE